MHEDHGIIRGEDVDESKLTPYVPQEDLSEALPVAEEKAMVEQQVERVIHVPKGFSVGVDAREVPADQVVDNQVPPNPAGNPDPDLIR